MVEDEDEEVSCSVQSSPVQVEICCGFRVQVLVISQFGGWSCGGGVGVLEPWRQTGLVQACTDRYREDGYRQEQTATDTYRQIQTG